MSNETQKLEQRHFDALEYVEEHMRHCFKTPPLSAKGTRIANTLAELPAILRGLVAENERLQENRRLSVWFGSMPESNGNQNWTAILHQGDIAAGFTIARSEYQDRVRYDADCVKYIIGEIESEPFILDYDGDLKANPPQAPAVPDTDDPAEAAYWNFDARRKGYGQWKEMPQSERDAFKAEYRDVGELQSRIETMQAVIDGLQGMARAFGMGEMLQVTLTAIREVAMVEELLDDNCARVRWLFNPVPEGQVLLWDHGDAPKPVAAAPSLYTSSPDHGEG